jgi:hypothetical protein
MFKTTGGQCFFQMSFCLIKCALLFLKVEEDLNIDNYIKKEKIVKLVKFIQNHI